MRADPYWDDFISTVFDSESSANVSHFQQTNSPSHEQMTENGEQNSGGNLATTPLHKAARFENVEEVRSLIRRVDADLERGVVEATAQVNLHKYTPLHFAAMAINPNPEIAKALINSAIGSNQKWLNAETEESFGKNTALHIAAANVNVTQKFIQAFHKADSLCRNSQNDTPYHVAAKSSNQEAIIYLLNTFSPTNNEWDVDDVDEGHKFNTAINICARNGNAKAVVLLIKHGADISQGVLHEIVLESVRNPQKIKKLIGVYQSIVDNTVTWRGLEEESDFLNVKGSDSYTELSRKIMVWLLTKPMEKYSTGNSPTNVIQCALEHGASAMFWQIVNTISVFRIDGVASEKWSLKENGNDTKVSHKDGHASKKKENRYWTVFDVTNYTAETILDCGSSDQKQEGCGDNSQNPLLCPPNSAVEDAVKEARHPNTVKRNFDDLPAPPEPYLTHLLLAFDQWRSSNILSAQPLKDLTEPYIKLVQRFYLILGLLQLIFMTCFTAFHTPTTCSLARMFNVSNALCNNSSSTVNSDNAYLSIFNHQQHWAAVLWLIWPTILITTLTFITLHYVQQEAMATRQQSEKIVLKTKDLTLSFREKFLETLLRLMLPISFCVAVLAWLGIYLVSESYEYYVDVTGMVLLSGWMANLYFFGAVRKNFSIFSLVVSKIIRKDIPSFMLFFGFTVLAYSLAMHTLRLSVCSPNESIDVTFLSVLSSAFGIGDFFEVTMTDSTCAGASIMYLFEITYFFYVLAAMIILLNVLIAMLNNRYEKAKSKTENIWRYQMLSVMRALESHKSLSSVIKKCLMPNRPQGSLYFKGEKYNRWYLRLVLPVDEHLVSSHSHTPSIKSGEQSVRRRSSSILSSHTHHGFGTLPRNPPSSH